MFKTIILGGFLICFSSMSSCERHGDGMAIISDCVSLDTEEAAKYGINICDAVGATENLKYEGATLNSKTCYRFGDIRQNGVLGANFLLVKKQDTLCEYKFVTYTFGTRESGYGAVSDQGGGGYQFKMDVIKLKPLFAPKGKWIDVNTEIIKLNSKKEILDFIQN